MPKSLKLLIAAFVGLDVFVVLYIGLAQLRLSLFGEGAIPGGGSALDMALFLLPLFVGYVAGDRLYYFMNYKQRAAARRSASEQDAKREVAAADAASVWEDRDWEDEPAGKLNR